MASDNASSPTSLISFLADDLARRWHAGERPLVEEYLARFPVLAANPEGVAELIYEELCLRQEAGEPDAAQDLFRRFPQWEERLRILVQCHDFLEPVRSPPQFPAAGDRFGDFQLLAELGRGAQGRVFLATQTGLADRPVALKFVPRSGHEHLSLARLQHTHIVPLYSVQDDLERDLRVLCMPYFGGATLAQMLDRLRDQPVSRLTGNDVLKMLQEGQAALPLQLRVDGPACRFLAQVSYARALCWLGLCLAEALQYTHERGLVHFDLKPSNVLWAVDGQPMLLDLHLAREPIAAGVGGQLWLGGTPPYMAPEQRQAMDFIEAGQRVPNPVDGRADLYALGQVLAEALEGGRPPPDMAIGPWLRGRNGQVPARLADILSRCVAPDPKERYPDAAGLADALRRHLADLPVRVVGARDAAEPGRKWGRSYARRLSVTGMVALTGVGLAATYVEREAYKARAALAEGIERQERGEYAAARESWQRGLAMAQGLPFHGSLAEDLRGRVQWAERAAAIDQLHMVAERFRAWHGSDDRGVAAAAALEPLGRSLWQNRSIIIARLDLESAPKTDQARRNLLDLAILWTDLRVRLATKEQMHACRVEALEVLQEAGDLLGPSSVLDRAARVHARALGRPWTDRKPAPEPRTAWEHFALGRSLFQEGDLEAAARHLDQATALEPQSFWPNFFKGKCAYRRMQYEDAILAFTACMTLAPDRAWCYYNRGLAFEALAKDERALADYDRALQQDPSLAFAAVNRGMLHFRAKHYQAALEDLHLAQQQGANPALVHYNRALIQIAQGDEKAAKASLEDALRHNPHHQEARSLADKLRGQP